MAELDYAFLAEYAKVEPGGNLTAVGASYTHLEVPRFPVQHLLSVAGRVRGSLGERPQLRLRVSSPTDSFTLEIGTELSQSPDVRPYGPANDTIGIQFALTLTVPLPESGLYRVYLFLDNLEARMLAFTALAQSGQA